MFCKTYWLSCLCCWFSLSYLAVVQAQGWELGGLGGGAFYFGDLNPKYGLQVPRPSLSFLMRRNYDGRVCLRSALTFAQISGDDALSPHAVQRARNLSFRSNIFEAQIGAEFNFISYHSKNAYQREDEDFTPFLSFGAGVFYHNPKTLYQGAWYALQPLGTEGQAPGNEYSLVQFGLLIGGGFKWNLNQNWSLNLDIQSRILATDYLDDVSGVYADRRVIEGYRGVGPASALADRSIEQREIPIGIPGHQRGDSRRNDSFLTFQLGLIYRFYQLSCPGGY